MISQTFAAGYYTKHYHQYSVNPQAFNLGNPERQNVHVGGRKHNVVGFQLSLMNNLKCRSNTINGCMYSGIFDALESSAFLAFPLLAIRPHLH
jgi:hypothetical protein